MMNYEIVMEVALQMLSRRRMTTQQIRQRLCKKFPAVEAIIERVIQRLSEMGYLDDLLYVQAFARDRMKFRPRGKKVLQFELMKKGLGKEIIEKGLGEIEIDEVEMARVLFEQYKRRSSFRNAKDRKSSLFRYLAGKGISFSAVKNVIDENQTLFSSTREDKI